MPRASTRVLSSRLVVPLVVVAALMSVVPRADAHARHLRALVEFTGHFSKRPGLHRVRVPLSAASQTRPLARAAADGGPFVQNADLTGGCTIGSEGTSFCGATDAYLFVGRGTPDWPNPPGMGNGEYHILLPTDVLNGLPRAARVTSAHLYASAHVVSDMPAPVAIGAYPVTTSREA